MLRERLGNQLLNDRTVQERLGLSRSAFYRYLQKGVLSVPLGRTGKNRRGWTEQEINLAKEELHEARGRA